MPDGQYYQLACLPVVLGPPASGWSTRQAGVAHLLQWKGRLHAVARPTFLPPLSHEPDVALNTLLFNGLLVIFVLMYRFGFLIFQGRFCTSGLLDFIGFWCRHVVIVQLVLMCTVCYISVFSAVILFWVHQCRFWFQQFLLFRTDYIAQLLFF